MWNQNALQMMIVRMEKSVPLLVTLEVWNVWMVSKQCKHNLALINQLTGKPENGNTYDIMYHVQYQVVCAVKHCTGSHSI